MLKKEILTSKTNLHADVDSGLIVYGQSSSGLNFHVDNGLHPLAE
jgi:hypothetical protein